MTDPTPPTTLYELRFDNDEYWIPLGLFASKDAAKDAWQTIAKKLHHTYRVDYTIGEVTLYADPPDDDAIEAMRDTIGEHNDDAVALDPEGDEDGDTPSLDEDPPPPPVSIGQSSLPI